MNIGDKVAWQLLDGATMTGTITGKGYSDYYVERVDGSQCSINASKLRAATPDDIESACRFFQPPIGPK